MIEKKYDFNKVIEKTDDSIVIEFSIPKESPYFDGHFPQLSILPAVAQVELILLFLKKYFNENIAITEIKRAKFTNPIKPSFTLVLLLKKNKNNVSFKINSPDGEIVYSLGTLSIKE